MRDPAEDLANVFDPWAKPEEPAAPSVPESEPSPATFLRVKGVPEIRQTARRVEAVDHHLMIQDLLDLPDGALRVLFWPRPGRMAADTERTRATLEFFLPQGEPREVVAECWSGDGSEGRTALGRISVEKLDLAWVSGRVLDFIELTLKEA